MKAGSDKITAMDIAVPPRTRRRRPSSQEDPVRSSLTPEHWIAAASELLVDGGVDLVRVDVVAKVLQVTRGSFYWHFRDRDDLLARMLKAWRAAATDQLVERFEKLEGSASKRLQEVLTLPFRGRAAERAARIELAIRDWARRDEMARRAVDEVDERRIGYIAQCFSELGFGIADARARAFLFYGYQVAESLLRNQGTAGQKAERSALLQRLLLQR
jgi:AcrR family transcriptional regulator